jgi:hypothetical protein
VKQLRLEELTRDAAKAAFRVFTIRDVNPLGGTSKRRRIYEPNEAMDELHQRLIHALRALHVPLPYAFGALPGRSRLQNVLQHRRAAHIYLLDLHDAYPSVDGERLARILCQLDPELRGKIDEVYAFLWRYCLAHDGGLFVGAPASPDLFNLYAGTLLDGPLAELVRRYGLVYSRFLDDLTFSSPSAPIGRRKRKAIRQAVIGSGFTLSEKKTRVVDLRKGPIVICGIGLEQGGRTFVPRHYTGKIRGLIHRAAVKGDVPLSAIHGRMGVFGEATPRFRLGRTPLTTGPNHTERRIIAAYGELRSRRAQSRQTEPQRR